MTTSHSSEEHLIGERAENVPVFSPTGAMLAGEPINLNEKYDEKYANFRLSEPYRYFLLMLGSAGCLLASFCYTFALFSEPMMKLGGLNMSKMATISTVMLVFSYFTLPYAFIFDAYGPTPVLVVGTILLPLGSLLMGLTFQGVIEANTVNFSVFLAIMGGGCIVFDLGTVVSVLSWFPTNRGPVVAVMKSFAGLGTAIMGTIQLAFFETNPAGFFFCVMALALLLGLLTTFGMRLPPYHLTSSQEKNLCPGEKAARHTTKEVFLTQKTPRKRMGIALGFVVFLIVFLPVQSAVVVYKDLGRGAKVAFAVIAFTACLLYPVICLPLRCLGGMNKSTQVVPEPSHPDHNHACVLTEEVAEQEEIVHDLEFVAPAYQTTFLEGLRTLRLWCIFAACFAIIGAQLVILFHYVFITSALRGKPADDKFKALLATMSGVGSAIGRLGLSGFEMWSQRKKVEERIPITMALFFPNVLTVLGLLFYIVIPGDGLVFAHFVMALGNGAAAAAAVLVFRGIFAKEPAKHYNFGFLAAMVSAILLNRLAYGEWYEAKAADSPGGVCFHKSCVLMPLLLMLGLNLLALLGVAYVHIEYSGFSRDVIASRAALLQQNAESAEECMHDRPEELAPDREAPKNS